MKIKLFKPKYLKAKVIQFLRHRANLTWPAYLVLFALLVGLLFAFRRTFFSGWAFTFEKNIWFYLSLLSFSFLGLSALVSFYEYHGFGPQEGIVRRGKSETSRVALTFDDGPSPIYTPQILDVLKEKGVKATFFLVGRHVEKYPEIARRIVAEGHEIGNHTYSHRDLVPATRAPVVKEVKKAERAIEAVCGQRTVLFRPPRGIYSNAVRKTILKLGYTIILWSLSTQDWRLVSPKFILKRVKRFCRPGSIILFHDSGALIKPEGGSRSHTVEALPEVIDWLKENNYEITTISSLIGEAKAEEELSLEPRGSDLPTFSELLK